MIRVIFSVLVCAASLAGTLGDDYEDPEIYMNTMELIENLGYPAEEHLVHTSDGYILQVQRITHGKSNCPNDNCTTKGVVLLQHGLLSCGACWVENLANESLGFILADAGYDVWIGNSRGTTYGLGHETLSTDDEEFWAFSWDEMADYDLPATVDYILSETGQTDLSYVGHSQGTQIAFAALSTNDQLNDKIKVFAALAPVTYLSHLEGPLRLLSLLPDWEIHLLLGRKEFLSQSQILTLIGAETCDDGIGSFICQNILFLIAGYDQSFVNTNMSRIPVYVGQHPAGTSIQNMIHYKQAIKTDKFRRYDFGSSTNRKRYNQASAPLYDLGNIRTHVALFGGDNDWLATPTDVDHTWAELSGTLHSSYKTYSAYNHLDFLWSMKAGYNLYVDVLSLIESTL